MNGFSSISPERGWFEDLRFLNYLNLVAAYTAIGTAIDNPTRIIIINNLTDVPVMISLDGTADHMVVPAGGNYIIDSSSNGISLPAQTRFYAQRFTPAVAPTYGDVIVSIGYNIGR